MINQPKDVFIKVSYSGVNNNSIPPISQIYASINLGSEIKSDTLDRVGGTLCFRNIPAKMLGQEVYLQLRALHCQSIDTTFSLAINNSINIKRDLSAYGHISAKVFDLNKEKPVQGATVKIKDVYTLTDYDGFFEINIPMELQETKYTVEIDGFTLTDNVIYMPCATTAVLFVQ